MHGSSGLNGRPKQSLEPLPPGMPVRNSRRGSRAVAKETLLDTAPDGNRIVSRAKGSHSTKRSPLTTSSFTFLCRLLIVRHLLNAHRDSGAHFLSFQYFEMVGRLHLYRFVAVVKRERRKTRSKWLSLESSSLAVGLLV